MNLQDTLTTVEQKLDISKKIKIYLCGVTVYDESHIGHARTIIVFDVLRKYLESKEVEVEFIQNFTDDHMSFTLRREPGHRSRHRLRRTTFQSDGLSFVLPCYANIL